MQVLCGMGCSIGSDGRKVLWTFMSTPASHFVNSPYKTGLLARSSEVGCCSDIDVV